MEKHPIDDFFKKQLEERPFTFDEKNWENMGQMIDQAEQSRKRRKRGWLFFFLLLALGSAIGIWALWPIANVEQEAQMLLPADDSQEEGGEKNTDPQREETFNIHSTEHSANGNTSNAQLAEEGVVPSAKPSPRASTPTNLLTAPDPGQEKVTGMSTPPSATELKSDEKESMNAITESPTLSQAPVKPPVGDGDTDVADSPIPNLDSDLRPVRILNENLVGEGASRGASVEVQSLRLIPSWTAVSPLPTSLAYLPTPLPGPLAFEAESILSAEQVKPIEPVWNVAVLSGLGGFLGTDRELTWGAQVGLRVERSVPGDRLSVFGELQYQRLAIPAIGLDTVAEITGSFGRDYNRLRREATSLHTLRLPLGVGWRTQGGWQLEAGLGIQYQAGIRGQLIRDDALQPWERDSEQETAQQEAAAAFYGGSGVELDYAEFPRVYESVTLTDGWLDMASLQRVQAFGFGSLGYSLTPRWTVQTRIEYVFGDWISGQENSRWSLNTQLRILYYLK